MKLLTRLSVMAFSCLLLSCSKESSETGDTPSPGTGTGGDYQPTTAGSEWKMSSTTAGSYTIKSLGSDTLIQGKKFFKFDNSESGRFYINKDNGIYTSHSEHPMDEDLQLSMIMLKDAPAGTAWTNVVGYMGVNNDFKYKVLSRDATKTVNGKEYKDVITVEYEATTQNPLTGGTMKFATGRTYTAKGIGPIASKYEMDLFGMKMEDSTYLVSYTIK